jgi:hypothetical protein
LRAGSIQLTAAYIDVPIASIADLHTEMTMHLVFLSNNARKSCLQPFESRLLVEPRCVGPCVQHFAAFSFCPALPLRSLRSSIHPQLTG